jgi:PKD repeat protein
MAYQGLERSLAATLTAALCVAAAGCTMKEAEVPPITGPSGFANTVEMTASPDVVPEDGTSRSIINLVARDANALPVANLQIRLVTNVGSLSSGQVSTDGSGRASVVFTAPLTAFPGFDAGTIANIVAIPIGNNFDNAQAWSVAIRLVPPAVIMVPGAPVAAFGFGPPNPKVGDAVLFDASASFDPDGSVVGFEWEWGDGDIHGFGKNQDHDFAAPGTYFVTLTVTDNSGLKSSVTRAINVIP